MPRPDTIIFDLGKVLLDFDYQIAARKVAASGHGLADPMTFFTAHSDILVQYESGLLTSEGFFGHVCAGTGYRGSLEEFSGCFGDIFTEMSAMTAMQSALRASGLRTFIFSNTNELAIRHIRRAFPFFGNFDGYFYSYEHGVMKPESKFYKIVERDTGRNGPKLLYIDDRLENVEAGAKRGWQVILQETPDKTIAAVKQLGLL